MHNSLIVHDILLEFLNNQNVIDIVIYRHHSTGDYTIELYVVFDVLPDPIQVTSSSLEDALLQTNDLFKNKRLKDSN